MNPTIPLPPLPDPDWRRRFRRRLLAWYDRSARDLPWRGTRDPYAVWVSEIMLQQTQVATVVGYFERFLERFPTITALAEAEEREVLRLWEGLGYYSRARRLREAARQIVQRHDARFPCDPRQARRLPGIGRYTAGAILSIALDAREPILEANTTRLFCRLLAYEGDPTTSSGSELLWRMAETVLPRKSVGRFNQALMELGSTICVARDPDCDTCPVATLCPTMARGLQTQIPQAKKKTRFETRHEGALLVRRRGRILLVKCPDGGRWAGLWDLPRFPINTTNAASIGEQLIERLRETTGVEAELGRHLQTLKHSVTRFRITLDCFEATYRGGVERPPVVGMRFVSPRDLDDYPLSTTGRKLSRHALGG